MGFSDKQKPEDILQRNNRKMRVFCTLSEASESLKKHLKTAYLQNRRALAVQGALQLQVQEQALRDLAGKYQEGVSATCEGGRL